MRNISNGDERNRKVAYCVLVMLLLPILFMSIGDRLSRKAHVPVGNAVIAETVVVGESYSGETISSAEIAERPELLGKLTAVERSRYEKAVAAAMTNSN